jgi:hypothetical protein
MKKFTTSIAALLVFTAASFATGTSKTTASTESKVAAKAAVASYSLSQLIEENSTLKMQLETLIAESEEAKSKLEYTGMMHTTISNLQKEEMSIAEGKAKCQLDYAKMMTATLVNLAKVADN